MTDLFVTLLSALAGPAYVTRHDLQHLLQTIVHRKAMNMGINAYVRMEETDVFEDKRTDAQRAYDMEADARMLAYQREHSVSGPLRAWS